MLKRMLIIATTLVMMGLPASHAGEKKTEGKPETAPSQSFEGQFELTVVNVVAYVTNKKGHPVTDLKRGDFRIFQDGQERPISHFQLYTEELYRTVFQGSAPEAPITKSAGPETPQEMEIQPIYIVLYVDNENLHPMDRNRVLSKATEFVRKNLQPPVQMMVAAFDKRLKIIQPFTDDSTLVVQALRDQRMKTGGTVSRDSDRKRIMDKMRRYKQDPNSGDANGKRNVWALLLGAAEEEANDLLFTLQALRATVSMMAGLPGKKSIVYVSNGLPMIAGMEMLYGYANAYDEPSALTQFSRWDQTPQFNSLVAAANSQNVSFYTIGAGGLRHASIATAESAAPGDSIASGIGEENYLDSLRFMAKETGGKALVNTNDFALAFDKISSDLFTYYSMGYTLTLSGGDKVHNVKVTLPGHPEYNLRYRRRYVEKSLETRVRDKVMTALLFPLEENPFHIKVSTLAPAPAAKDRWTLPVEISFPVKALTLLPEGEDFVAHAVLMVAARDSAGGQSDLVRQVHEVRIPSKNMESLGDQRWTIHVNLLMEAGKYKVSVGLMDQTSSAASYTQSSTFIQDVTVKN